MTSRRARPAAAVGAGILLSRITGLARDVAFAAFLGTRVGADAYWAAIRIPNIIRNLLGEGTLSASFVPVYSEILRGEDEKARGGRLASDVLGVVIGAATLLSGLGILLAPLLTRLIAPGFDAAATQLTVSLVRILFPMSGLLIVGAWCLGVLNSHRRFFLPFVAPVLWNLSQVGGLLLGARLGWTPLVVVLAWSALLGSLLQVGFQLPVARRLAGTLRPSFRWSWEPTRRVIRNTGPVISSQGIFQISSFVDVLLATLLGTGALSSLAYAQRLVYLPLSLFGISVAAASLPEMSRETAPEALRPRITGGFLSILFYVLPSAVLLLLFGDLVIRTVYLRGQFSQASAAFVGGVLIAYALGLVATSSIKLFASGFHALQDTRTPMRIAAASVGTGIALGAPLALGLRGAGWGPLAAVGLALGGAAGAWLNLLLLWRALTRRVGRLLGGPEIRVILRLAAGTVAAAGAGALVRSLVEPRLAHLGLAGTLATLGAVLLAGAGPYLAIAGPAPRRGLPLARREADDA